MDDGPRVPLECRCRSQRGGAARHVDGAIDDPVPPSSRREPGSRRSRRPFGCRIRATLDHARVDVRIGIAYA
jgi:hypothetical protein